METDRATFTSVQFSNYKALSRYSIKLADTNILVGPNNCGKSTILGVFRALDVALRRARTRNPSYMYGPQGHTFGWTFPDELFPVSLENVHTNYNDTQSLVSFRLSNANRLHLFFPADGGWSLIPESRDRPVRTVTEFKRAFGVSIAVVPILGPVDHHEQLVQADTVSRSMATHLASRHFRNYWYHRGEGFDKFARLVAESWPGMDILRPERTESGSNVLSMFVQENRITRELYWSGFGFQIWCQLLTHLSIAADASILVVDEPEVYLHPDVQRQLLPLLRSANVPVLTASHSSEIIAEADPIEIVLIDKTMQSSRRLKDVAGIQEALRAIGSIQNITLTRIARNGRLLFTEGSKDYELLRQFARRLGFTQLASGTDLTAVSTDGHRAKDQVKAFQWGVAKAFKERLSIALILDRDFYCDEEILDIEQEFIGLELFHIHGRKEIENYLIIPDVLQRVLEQGATERRRLGYPTIDPPSNAVETMLQGITAAKKTELLGQYVGKRLNYLQKSRKDTSTIATETLQSFELKWADPRLRLNLVSGKIVLGELRDQVNSAYGVSLTNHRIIAALAVDEIPDELCQLIRRLEDFRAKDHTAKNHLGNRI